MNKKTKEQLEDINIKWMGQILDYVDTKEHLLELYNYITNLQQENEILKEKNKRLQEDAWRNNTNLMEMVKEELEKSNCEECEICEDYKSRIEKATKDLFELKDVIYKPETRDENIPIQQKISSIIKQLNGRSDE